tara:strand:+ start:66 stop:425 length:360 start_codon:yes stop_codon:yes gene_type:complete
MKKSDIEKFRQRLITLRDEMNHLLKETSKDVRTGNDGKGYSQHSADEGTDDFQQMVSLEMSNKEQGVLRQIERALEKIDDGTYGKCDISGKTIPLKRLEAIPYATMTVESQEELEKGQK